MMNLKLVLLLGGNLTFLYTSYRLKICGYHYKKSTVGENEEFNLKLADYIT